MVNPPLEPGVGYGIVLGLGFAFALGMVSHCAKGTNAALPKDEPAKSYSLVS